jgi:GH24 family phage-related lysozyme (muramidase)
VYFIMREEGFYAHPDDVSDTRNCTVGYGLKLHPGPCNGTEPARFTRGINPEEGLRLLMNRLVRVAQSVRSRVTAVLTQNQLDMLISFAYNGGEHSGMLTNLLREANARHGARVVRLLLSYTNAAVPGGHPVHSEGLAHRRAKEAAIWERADYGSGAPRYHRGCRQQIDNCPASATPRRRPRQP